MHHFLTVHVYLFVCVWNKIQIGPIIVHEFKAVLAIQDQLFGHVQVGSLLRQFVFVL